MDFDFLNIDDMDNGNLNNTELGMDTGDTPSATSDINSTHFTILPSHNHNIYGVEEAVETQGPSAGEIESFGLGIDTHGSAPWQSNTTDYPWENSSHNSAHIHDSEYVDLSQMKNEMTFKGYTRSEIENHIAEAKSDISYAKSQIRSHTESLKNSGYPETEKMHIQNAERDLRDAQAELSKWQDMKPSK